MLVEKGVEAAGGEDEAPAPLDREADRARLFRMAIALGVPDAVSMTAAELVAAIDRAQGGEEPSAAEAAANRFTQRRLERQP